MAQEEDESSSGMLNCLKEKLSLKVRLVHWLHAVLTLALGDRGTRGNCNC